MPTSAIFPGSGTLRVERSAPGVRRFRGGFSLVEVLAAMTILAVIVLMLNRIFADASRAWLQGTRTAELNSTARALMDYFTRDLVSAVFDPPAGAAAARRYDLGVKAGGTALGAPWSELFFLSAGVVPTNSSGQGQICEVRYGLAPMPGAANRFQLVRSQQVGGLALAFNQASATAWFDGADAAALRSAANQALVIDNVRNFRAVFIDESGAAGATGSTRASRLVYLDLFFELMDSETARRVDDLWASNPTLATRIINERARRYYTRIEFPNRNGLAKGG
jgi:prepilin-type N-terminal cleavage/methylation domain-containing protein